MLVHFHGRDNHLQLYMLQSSEEDSSHEDSKSGNCEVIEKYSSLQKHTQHHEAKQDTTQHLRISMFFVIQILSSNQQFSKDDDGGLNNNKQDDRKQL